MSTETLVPTAIEASTNLTGAVTAIDEDLDAPWVPPDFPGLSGWWDANDLSGQGDGSTVTSLADKSGNSYDWGQHASDALPTKETVGGYPAVACSDSGLGGSTVANLIGNTGLIAVVFQFNGNPGTTADTTYYSGDILVGDADATFADYGYFGVAGFTLSGVPTIKYGVITDINLYQVAVAASVNTPHVFLGYRASDGTLSGSIDGGTPVTAASSGTPIQYLPVVLGLGRTHNFTGDLFEIVTVLGNGTSGDRTSLVSYLKTKYGIA